MSDDPLIRSAAAEALGLIDPPSTASTHYEALGRFIAAFANAEGVLHVISRKLSGLDDEKARLLFGGMRITDISDRIRGFIKLDRDNGKDDVFFADTEACLDQIGLIASSRHNIVHRGATYFGGIFIVSNSMIAKTIAGIENELVSESTLKDMTMDCGVIFLRLIEVSKPNSPNDNWIATLRRTPWRYKPPAPKSRNPKRRDRYEGQPPPPDASRG